MSEDQEIVPTVGMGLTHGVGSDCYPFEVVRIITPHTIEIRAMETGKNKMVWPNQDYDLTSNPNAPCFRVRKSRKRKNLYVSGSSKYWLGHARYYQDPHF